MMQCYVLAGSVVFEIRRGNQRNHPDCLMMQPADAADAALGIFRQALNMGSRPPTTTLDIGACERSQEELLSHAANIFCAACGIEMMWAHRPQESDEAQERRWREQMRHEPVAADEMPDPDGIAY